MKTYGLEIALIVLKGRLTVNIPGIFIAYVFGRRLLNEWQVIKLRLWNFPFVFLA